MILSTHPKLRNGLIIALAFVVVVRMLAPSFILNRMNGYLENFSPLYSLHIEKLHLHFFRMAYSFEGVQGVLKHPPKDYQDEARFLAIENVDVSLAWRELVRGRVVTDVDLAKVNISITQTTIDALSGVDKTQAKADAKNVKDATVPFNLERLRCQDSKIDLSDMAGVPAEQHFILAPVNVTANNLTPTDQTSLSLFTIIGTIQGDAKIKLVGQARLKKNPVDWSVNVEMKEFDLLKLNPFARSVVPVTFKSGKLSLYSAARSMNGEVKGYAKPFLRNLVFVGDKGDFKNVGQFFIEIIGTIGNFFLKNDKTHSLATKISFHTEHGKMEIDTLKAIAEAVKNDFGSGLSQSLDETLELP